MTFGTSQLASQAVRLRFRPHFTHLHADSYERLHFRFRVRHEVLIEHYSSGTGENADDRRTAILRIGDSVSLNNVFCREMYIEL